MKDAKKMPMALDRWLQDSGYSGPYQRQPLSGGDINDTFLLRTKDGQCFCIKQNATVPDDFFACEAEGLAAIRESKTVRVPQVYATGPGFILMEYIKLGTPKRNYWQTLGEQLAAMHLHSCNQFGFVRNNYCGRIQQINNQTEDGYLFFRDHRLLYQAELAVQNGELTVKDLESIARLGDRLAELIPEQQAALLHGDLWSGNTHCDFSGEPAIIDPAVYWGWPESDLAMTLLFGGFDDVFYQSYERVRPLESGWRERAAIYNLYHLLNHANHFGAGYAQQAMAIVRRYCP